MDFRFLAISDTHLGEDTSVLGFPQGRQRLWEALGQLLGPSVNVAELILLGDIPDRTLSSTAQITTQTNAFMRTLGSAINARKLVYVPGNHDHTMWTAYQRQVHAKAFGTTPVTGEPVVSDGAIVHDGEAVRDMLSVLFGYPAGSGWTSIAGQEKHDVLIANPIYAQPFKGRTYAFAHGTHFRRDVTLPSWLKKVIDVLEMDHLLGGIELEAGKSADKAQSLAQLEEFVAPFVDTLWPSSGDVPTSQSDQLWYLLTSISGKFGHKRSSPEDSVLYSRAELGASHPDRVRRLVTPADVDASLRLAESYFFRHMNSALADAGLLDPVTFVYGDTHDGGFGDLPQQGMRVYNTGAWVVHNRDDHPPCHVFAVDEFGEEYLLDISFRGVHVGRRTLLEIASEDAENKKNRSSRLLRFVLDHLPTPRQ